MRILLAASASYHPPRGGSTRSNLVWLRALARLGHQCRVVCSAVPGQTGTISLDGLEIERHPNLARDAAPVAEAIALWEPDLVLVSSEDVSHILLRESYRAAPSRLVYLAHTPQWFPFGPEAWHPDREAAEILRDAVAIVAIGKHMAAYIEAHLGRPAQVIHPSIYGAAPWPEYRNYAQGNVLLINPCQVKGLPIFLELARRFPQQRFEALRGWGTTERDLAALRALPNVQVTEPIQDIEEVFARTKLLLAPSLWYEGYGLVATEAFLRGIPVLAADYGGLAESAAASAMRQPILPIRRWTPEMDSTGMPIGDVDAQPLEAWAQALGRMLSEPLLYERERNSGQAAARALVEHWQPSDLAEFLSGLRPKRRRILLIHNSTYFPASGGGDKSNRLLMEHLARQGHTVAVFTRLERFGADAHQAYRTQLGAYGIQATEHPGGLEFQLDGVRVHAITRESNLRQAFRARLEGFQPDLIFASTDDPAHLFLDLALEHPHARVIYLVRATVALPFGPDASTLNEDRAARLARADAVVGVSHYVAEYCRTYAQLDAVHVPISLSDDRNPPDVGRFENPYITLVNPSGVKGLPILLALADALPDLRFAAVPSWGTTSEDIAALEARANIRILERADDITDILRQTRVTLVPSLWAEARSRVVLESLSRGVPVLASDVGGLREAMCGMDFVLPVEPIRLYKASVSEQMAPEAVIPAQDVAPWRKALVQLTDDASFWSRLSRQGREAALKYIEGLSTRPLEFVFDRTLARPKRSQSAGPRPERGWSAPRRKLLNLRIRKRLDQKRDRFFPLERGALPGEAQIVLFPWAGAGGLSWRFAEDTLGSIFRLLPVVLPQRENRAGYPQDASLPGLARSIAQELRTVLNPNLEVYFLGHSMGAALAYETALLWKGPLSGFVAGSCRAPQLRLNLPAVSQAALGGLSPLEADLALFNSYRPGAIRPLACPLWAFRGEEETGLSPSDVDAWSELTTNAFHSQSLPGGHFWIKENGVALLRLLAGAAHPATNSGRS